MKKALFILVNFDRLHLHFSHFLTTLYLPRQWVKECELLLIELGWYDVRKEVEFDVNVDQSRWMFYFQDTYYQRSIINQSINGLSSDVVIVRLKVIIQTNGDQSKMQKNKFVVLITSITPLHQCEVLKSSNYSIPIKICVPFSSLALGLREN